MVYTLIKKQFFLYDVIYKYVVIVMLTRAFIGFDTWALL